jgi:hypothetical protein
MMQRIVAARWTYRGVESFRFKLCIADIEPGHPQCIYRRFHVIGRSKVYTAEELNEIVVQDVDCPWLIAPREEPYHG